MESLAVTDAAVTLSADGTTVSIDPVGDLAAGKHYYVRVDAGAFEDARANPSEEIAQGDWTFSTADLGTTVAWAGVDTSDTYLNSAELSPKNFGLIRTPAR